MAKTLADLEREKRELNKKIAAAKKRSMPGKKKSPTKKKKVSKYNIRKRFPNFASNMDSAARQMFG